MAPRKPRKPGDVDPAAQPSDADTQTQTPSDETRRSRARRSSAIGTDGTRSAGGTRTTRLTRDPPAMLRSQTAAQRLRTEQLTLDRRIAGVNQQIMRTEQALAEARTQAATPAQIQRLNRERDSLVNQRVSLLASAMAIEQRWKVNIESLVTAVDPNDAAGDRPLLMLPVRLETRYTDDRRGLRVRIFPDDMHIDALERGLSTTEAQAGQAWWTRIWALPLSVTDDPVIGTAWRELISTVGRNRARWCALACTPTNLAQRGTALAPAFPAVNAPLKGPALARLLPDQFTVSVLMANGQRVNMTGRPIPQKLPISLFAQDGRPMKQVNGVTLIEGAEWIADFNAAVDVGLAMTVTLPVVGAGIQRVLAFGVRRTGSGTQSAAELADVLQAHACGNGLAFVPAGTATNNTDDGPAGWQRRLDPAPPGMTVSATAPAGSHADVLASALGVPASLFNGLDQAHATDPLLAGHAAAALWPATWGSFLDRINRVDKGRVTLPEADRDRAREFAIRHVRGRGPLPMLRVGRQPYGVLPVSLVRDRLRPATGDAFEARLLGLLRKLRGKWLSASQQVPRVGRADTDRILPELLGQAPASFAMRVRTVLAQPIAALASKVSGGASNELVVEQLIDELIWEDLIANASLVNPTGSLSSSRPLWLAMTDPARDASVMRELLAGQTPQLSSVLQTLVQIGLQRARAAVDQASAQGRFDVVLGTATALPASVKDRVMGMAARQLRNEPVPLSSWMAEIEAVEKVQPNIHQVDIEALQPLAGLRTSFADMALQSTHAEARQELGLRATSAWLRAQARLTSLQDAITAWATRMEQDAAAAAQAGLPPVTGSPPPIQAADHRMLVAETLDCASHRLDAWLTGLVEARRARMAPASQTGLTLGAFGWVENLTPAGATLPDGGYIHAPSPAHATTAAILRSAYLSHNSSSTDTGAFSIDLTSRRVRRAQYLLDGVRQGQTLSTLLGYAIERAVREANLDRFILSLRRLAPLQAARLTDRNEPPAAGGLEMLAASNVADGIELIEKHQGKVVGWNAQTLRNTLSQRPADNPYLRPQDPWPALTDAEWNRIDTALRAAAEDLDAVADLLMAESVHQLAQGNVHRAAAAMDAAAGGDTPAPAPDVIASRIDGMPVAHRLMMIMPPKPATWAAKRPRAQVSPELEGWAVSRLGKASAIAVVRLPNGKLLTMADTGWCALDLVFSAGQPGPLQLRLQRALATRGWPSGQPWMDEPDGTLPGDMRAIGDVAELADSMRLLIAASKPLGPTDLCAPGTAETRPELMEIAARDPGRADVVAAVNAWRDRINTAIDQLDVRSKVLAQLLQSPSLDTKATRQALSDLQDFGIDLPEVDDAGLATTADLAYSEAARRIYRAEAALSPTNRPMRGEDLAAAAEALLGDGFRMPVPLAAPAAADAWSAAMAPARARASRAALRRYIADTSSVRDGMRRFNEMVLLAEAAGQAPTLSVAQLSGPGSVIPDWWVGDRMPADAPTPDASTVSATIDLPAGYTPAQAMCGLLVDHWVDVLPDRQKRGPAANAPIESTITTGVSFEAAAAGARAPQSLLLAISPDGARWNTERLVELLEETLEMARMRLVSLERTNGAARVLPALYSSNWSLQGEAALDLRFVAQKILDGSAIAAFSRESAS